MGTRFAGLYKTDGADTNSVEAMEKFSQWDLGGEYGVDAQLGTDSLRVLVPGNHFLNCTMSFKGEAGVTYYVEIRRNDLRIASGFLAGQYVAVAGKPYDMTTFGAFLLREGDLISVYIGSDKPGGGNFQLVYGQFGIMSL